MAAASFDDMIAITGYTIFIDIAVKPPGNQVWSIMHGPLSVVFGILAGFLAAYLCAFTKLWNNKVKRTAVVLLAALFMKFIFDRYGFTSGGALGSLTLGLMVKELWARGQPGPFALKETNGEFIRSVSLSGIIASCCTGGALPMVLRMPSHHHLCGVILLFVSYMLNLYLLAQSASQEYAVCACAPLGDVIGKKTALHTRG